LFSQAAINRSRQQVWRRQASEFFAQATIEADRTVIETSGEKKSGIGINYQYRRRIRSLVWWQTRAFQGESGKQQLPFDMSGRCRLADTCPLDEWVL